MKPIGKGAEAELFRSRFLSKETVVKKRIEKAYRIKQIDCPLRKRRTKTEARLLSAAKKAGVRVPVVYGVDEFQIVMDEIKGKLLRDKEPKPQDIRKAGEYLALLHAADIVHGDYTLANLMVDQKGILYVIDFGLGQLSTDDEDKAVDILLMKKSMGNKKLYSYFLRGYRNYNLDHPKVLRKLEDVEKRGRYVVRAMQA